MDGLQASTNRRQSKKSFRIGIRRLPSLRVPDKRGLRLPDRSYTDSNQNLCFSVFWGSGAVSSLFLPYCRNCRSKSEHVRLRKMISSARVLF
ncbi:hypothetical protein IMY05_C2998004500 [Salix suchowensis]|nr:hypothetical protein IMY05_C2998004500 [Salix suchowensis]